jgi:2',3'-cyclic-nucleotide 2'-phosphodiesterase (5'-nucleotidase family)
MTPFRTPARTRTLATISTSATTVRAAAIATLLGAAAAAVGCDPTSDTPASGPTAAATLTPGDTLTLAVMGTTDLHGWILPFDYGQDADEPRYGLAKVATIVDSIRGVHPHTILVDAGDFLQGNALAEYFARVDPGARSYPLLDVLGALSLDATALGNHEFNFGIPYLMRRLIESGTPALGANIYRHGTKEPAFNPYRLLTVGGVRIGIIGLTTPGSAVWDGPLVAGELDFGDGVEAAERFVREVREAGAEYVVVVAHTGMGPGSSYSVEGVGEENFGQRMLETVPGIDLFVFGHSHRVTEGVRVQGPTGDSIPVMQAGRWGSHVALAEVRLTRDPDGALVVIDETIQVLSVEDRAPSPRILAMVTDAHAAVRAHVNEALASTPDLWDATDGRLTDTPIVDFIHHVQRQVTGAQLSAASAFDTGARFGPGDITRRDLTRIYPYENMLWVVEVTGAQIRAYLEHTSQYYAGVEDGQPAIQPGWPGYNFDSLDGIDYALDLRQPVGQRVQFLNHAGAPVADDQRFTLAVNSYRAAGGGDFTMLADAPVLWRSEIPVRTYLEGFLAETPILTHDLVFTPNWSLLW